MLSFVGFKRALAPSLVGRTPDIIRRAYESGTWHPTMTPSERRALVEVLQAALDAELDCFVIRTSASPHVSSFRAGWCADGLGHVIVVNAPGPHNGTSTVDRVPAAFYQVRPFPVIRQAEPADFERLA